jgi:hypothetical protein
LLTEYCIFEKEIRVGIFANLYQNTWRIDCLGEGQNSTSPCTATLYTAWGGDFPYGFMWKCVAIAFHQSIRYYYTIIIDRDMAILMFRIVTTEISLNQGNKNYAQNIWCWVRVGLALLA